MKRLRWIAAVLCALLMLSLPVMADGFGMGNFDSDAVDKTPQVDNPSEVAPTPSTEPPQESAGDSNSTANDTGDAVGTDGAGTESSGSSSWDDDIWNWSANGSPNVAPPSEKQQELEEARREWEEKQNQREEAFREAEQENAALPEEEEEPKKSAGSKAEETAPTELVLPQRQGKTVSPVRYILIGALLAAALCIAIYLFTHPAREEDPEQEQK